MSAPPPQMKPCIFNMIASTVIKVHVLSEYGYDDVYGRSLEDEPAVSPSTAG